MNNAMQKAKRLMGYCMNPYKAQFIWAIVLNLLGAILGTMNPYIIGLGITELTKNVLDINAGVAGAQVNFSYMLVIVLVLAASALVRQCFTYLASYLLAGGVQSSFYDLRSMIESKINRLPVSYFDKSKLGNVLNTVTNDVDTVANAMQQSLLPIVYAVTNVIMTFVMMMVISVPLGLGALVIIPAAFFISKTMMRRSQGHFRNMQNSLAELNAYIQERYSAFTVVKLFNDEQDTVKGFQEINNRLNSHGFKGSFASAMITPMMELLVNLVYIVMVGFTGYAVIFSGMALGNMQAFVQYIWLLYEPLGQITQMSVPVQTALASMGRIVAFLDEEEETEDAITVEEVDLAAFQGEVAFDNVQFAYSQSKPLIRGLSFKAKPGQKVAIVGATGAGKTTIINLLMRFYDIDAGDITIDGTSIYAMGRDNERALFGMVLQDAWLYHNTIRENIRFGRMDATDDEVIQAAKDANVHHFIKTLPGGYDMMISPEGDNVSLGQKQLLTIARAMLADPPILILDEATSSVDTRLEMLIQVAMKRAMAGRTSFVIAHRLSTIRDADLILVLEQGDIVEQGNHEQLIAQGGVYEKLYNSQFAQA